jgi:hypothetical protein
MITFNQQTTCNDHFAGAGKMVVVGNFAVQRFDDYQPSRFACSLIRT